VVIASSTDTHAGLVEAAARAGKAIFCEKPLDLDRRRAEGCLVVAKQSGVPLMVGFNRRFDPNFTRLEREIRDGRIGALELLTIISRDPAPPPLDFVRRSGGLFRDMMIQDVKKGGPRPTRWGLTRAKRFRGSSVTPSTTTRAVGGRSGCAPRHGFTVH
jgi:myo-inositol 2-dehydrogenase/D-chiro-inositol 1-dehydrogenase